MNKTKFFAAYFLCVVIGILLFNLISCTPEGNQRRAERKLARLTKNHPELIKTDSIPGDTNLAVPKINSSVEIDLKSDIGKVDSLLNKFADKIDPAALDSLSKGMNDIVNHAGDIDTTITTVTPNGTVKTHYKKQGKKVNIDSEILPDSINFKYTKVINTIQPIIQLKWYEEIFMKFGKAVGITGFSFLFLILILIAYRFTKWVLK
jgi:hypothetical protein